MDDFLNLEGYVYDLLNTIEKIHDENVEQKAEYYSYAHLFSKKDIDSIAEAWKKAIGLTIY